MTLRNDKDNPLVDDSKEINIPGAPDNPYYKLLKNTTYPKCVCPDCGVTMFAWKGWLSCDKCGCISVVETGETFVPVYGLEGKPEPRKNPVVKDKIIKPEDPNILKEALRILMKEEPEKVSPEEAFKLLNLNLGDKVVPHGKGVHKPGQTGEVVTLDHEKFEVGINFSYEDPKGVYSFKKYPANQLKFVERGVQCDGCGMFLNSNILEKVVLFSPLHVPGVEIRNLPYLKQVYTFCPECKEKIEKHAAIPHWCIDKICKEKP